MAKKKQPNLALVKGSETSTIKLHGRDKAGKKRTAILKATVIDDPNSTDPESHADEPDPFDNKRIFGKHRLITPRYPLGELTALKENSTELIQSIASMVTNTVGFGYQLREKRLPEGMREKFKDEIELEKLMLNARLDTLHPTMNLTMLREMAKDDQHANGNGYLELIDHPRMGELVAANYVRSYEIRLTEKSERPIKVLVPWVNPAKNFTIEHKPMTHRFRKFVMLRRGKPIWFKEAGDPRVLNKRTGEFDEDTKPGMRATSLLHFRVHSSLTPYGIPEWIGNLFSVYGSRSADELNWTSLKNNMIPSMFVIVENGILTEASITRLREWTEQQVANSLNRSKFLILEGETLEEGAPTPANFKIRVEPLAQLQKDDQLFQAYDANNRDKVRQAFRLPPIFVGRSDDYTRACYSEDTETLTENGWKRFCDVSPGEQIATLNPETNLLEYREPDGGLYAYPYKGEMYRFSNRNTDVLVTPDHDMWLSPIAANDYRKIHAEDVELARFSFRSAPDGFEPVPLPKFFDLPAVEIKGGPNVGVRPTIKVPVDLWIRFLAAFVADGSTTPEFVRGKKRCMYNVTFGVHKERKVLLFRELFSELAELGLRVFDESVQASGKHVFCLADKGLWRILRQLCGTCSTEKRFPQEFVHYPPVQLSAILDVLKGTDGTVDCREGRTSWSYSTTSVVLAGQVQQMCLHMGHRANICETPASGNKSTLYRVLITPGKKEHTVTQSDIEIHEYSGTVYCFNVPNHLFFTRRNGKVSVQGNTADTSRDIADEQVFAPERARDDFLINRFLLSRWGARFHTFRSNTPNITDDIELIRLMAFAEKSGGMTPRRADRIVRDVFGDDIGPLPQGIDLDTPFSISFAQAQQGIKEGTPSGTEPATKLVSGLLKLRKSIEDELESRVLSLEE